MISPVSLRPSTILLFEYHESHSRPSCLSDDEARFTSSLAGVLLQSSNFWF